MAKATKTWKIGERCVGGIITVTITGKVIKVQIKDWDFSKGSRKSSDQSNAKELYSGTVTADDADAYRKLSDFLNEATSSYYSDEVIKWIESKVTLNNTNW